MAHSAPAALVNYGEQDFNDGDFLLLTEFESEQGGEPAVLQTFNGSDIVTGNPFSASFTINYAPQTVGSATFTIGMYDHDSAAAGNQVASFTLDGMDLTGALNAVFEAHGGTQVEYNVYSLVLPPSLYAALSDGSVAVNLVLSPPGLQTSPTGPSVGNGAGLDFVSLDLQASAVPEPTGLAAIGLAAGGLATRRRRSTAK